MLRPDTRSWKTNPEVLSEMLDEFKIDSPPTPADFAMRYKNKVIFADICDACDLEAILTKASSDVPRALVVVQPEWKERPFWWMIENIPGEFIELPAPMVKSARGLVFVSLRRPILGLEDVL